MSTVLQNEVIVTLADLLARLGGVPLDRVLPGFQVSVSDIFRRARID